MQYSEEDYIQNALIRPPKDFSFIDNSPKTTRIIVDSRVRNKTLFPNPNNYEIVFEDDINDVSTAKLIYADIPMPLYLVNHYYDSFTYTVLSSPSQTVSIPHGDYTPTELSAAVTSAVSDLTVTYNARLDNFVFTGTKAFTLQFDTPIAQLFGFAQNKTYSSTANVITSEFRKNFAYNSYLIMDIEQFDLLKSIDRELNKTFAIIPKNYNNLNISDDITIMKSFSPPIPRLNKLRIKIYDRFGNPYDFQNMDHHFELLLTSFKQKRKYHH